MRKLLFECEQNFGPAPRRFSFWDRVTFFRVSKPRWLRANPYDALTNHLKNLESLFASGMVTWGHIVQANSLLFESGRDNCPAELVYSIENLDRINPEYLEQVAEELFWLKGTNPSEKGLKPIAHHLTDEMTRVFGLPVPSSISPALKWKISTTFVVRKHLPGRYLCSSLLPIVLNRREPHFAVPLPVRYWPQKLIEWWQE